MELWIVQTGEPLPVQGSNHRILRAGILGAELYRRGHAVTWWAPRFDHLTKSHLIQPASSLTSTTGVTFRLIDSPGYTKNISLARIYDHWKLGKNLKAALFRAKSPDLIFCGFPPIDTCYAAVEFAKARRVPVIVDIRDLWPDIFVDIAPSWARCLARLATSPLKSRAMQVFRNASAIIGTSPSFVNWGLQHAGRGPSNLDSHYPLAYQDCIPEGRAIAEAERFWDALGIGMITPSLIVSFVGSLGSSNLAEMMSAFATMRQLEREGLPVTLVVCGAGPSLNALKLEGQTGGRIVFPGWIDAAQIWTLLRRSHIGLIPYANRRDFKSSIPNKGAEYLSAGLPIATSVDGDFSNLIRRARAGWHYDATNPSNLALILREVAEQPEHRSEMARNARSLYEESFVARQVYGRLANHLEQVARAGKRPL